MSKKYKNIQELFDDMRVIHDMLVQYGKEPEASELAWLFRNPWTTGSEAITETLNALALVQESCSEKFSEQELLMFDAVREGAKLLLNCR